MGTSATRNALCDQFKGIRWSAADSDDTIRAIKQHNAVYDALCTGKR